MAEISGGMVAENSSILRCSGTYDSISLMSSTKPMLSISSASSSITVFTWLKSILPRFIKSSSRPGVATTTCTPRLSAFICTSMFDPPYTASS